MGFEYYGCVFVFLGGLLSNLKVAIVGQRSDEALSLLYP